LRASHIKPWRACANNHEGLDGYNGLLLAPNIDHPFDRGCISFTDNGDVVISPRMDAVQLPRLGLPLDRAMNVRAFCNEQQVYLAYHRDNVFLRLVLSPSGRSRA
jgi:hypothetical protein